MALTQREIQFLKKLKSQGVSRDDAFGRLESVSRQTKAKPTVKRSRLEKGIEGVKKGFSPGGGGRAFVDPFIGAAKGLGSTISGASSLGERSIKGIGRILTPKKFEKRLGFEAPQKTAGDVAKKKLFTPTSGFQKAGFGLEQVAEFAVPGAFGLKAGKGAGGLAKIAEGALTTGGITATQEGKLGKEAAIGAAIGGAIPGLSKLVGGLTGGTKRLIRKASGITGNEAKKLNIIAKTKNPNTNKPVYKGVEEFLHKKGIIGTGKETIGREGMKERAESLFETTISNKKSLIDSVTGKSKNKFSKLIGLLDKKVSSLNATNAGALDDEAKFIVRMVKKKQLSAKEIDKIRSIADDILFSEQDKLVSKNIRKLITPLRSALDKLDKTNTLKEVNTDIRLLRGLIGDKGALTKAVERGIEGKVSLLGGASLAASALPGVGQLASPLLGFEALSSIPQISAPLARGIISASESGVGSLLSRLASGAASKAINQ